MEEGVAVTYVSFSGLKFPFLVLSFLSVSQLRSREFVLRLGDLGGGGGGRAVDTGATRGDGGEGTVRALPSRFLSYSLSFS